MSHDLKLRPHMTIDPELHRTQILTCVCTLCIDH